MEETVVLRDEYSPHSNRHAFAEALEPESIVPRKSKKSASSSSSEGGYEDLIIDSAIQCFSRFGVAKTTIEDIASQAGIARATVYRTIPNREVLYEKVSYKLLGDIAEQIKPIIDRAESFEDSVVAGALEASTRFRKDKISMMLLESTGDLGVERFLIDQKSPVIQHMYYVFKDAMAKARGLNRLREDLTDMEIAAWLRSFIFIIVLSSNLTKREQEDTVRKFLIPSLIK